MTFRSVLVTRSYEQVVQQILERIHAGEFAPGERLPTERELGELFGVSRGVIREAIKVLGAMGLIESRQGSGTYVAANIVPSVSRALVLSAKPDEESLIHLVEFRRPLEVEAARLAAIRRTASEATAITHAAAATVIGARAASTNAFVEGDANLHRQILAAARNPYLQTTLVALYDIIRDLGPMVVRIAGSISVSAEQHQRLAAAIVAQDADAAASIMDEHIVYAANALRNVLDLPPDQRGDIRIPHA
jgi:GntR family transcriptional regulator, transcriptional repressor for pyruvate dehydrogenase complex